MQTVDSPPAAPEVFGPLVLRGTLRARGADYLIEHLLEPAVNGNHWTTSRQTRLLETAATHGRFGPLIGQLVTVTGRPGYNAARHATFVMVERIDPLDAAADPT